MQIYVMLQQRGWSQRTRFRSRPIPFPLFTLFSPRADRTGGPILTIYTSYNVFLHKEVPFRDRDETATHLGQIPKTILGREYKRFQA